jgi:beta-lactamase class A
MKLSSLKSVIDKNVLRSTLIASVFFILGGLVSYKIFSTPPRDLRDYKSSTVRKNTDNKLISPLLLLGDSPASFVDDSFSKEVKEYIEAEEKNGDAVDVSFYLRNLNNNTWTGNDEDKHFAPASLMKVPILIAVLKESEKDPGFLNKKVFFAHGNDANEEESFQPKEKIQPGKNYSIDELLRYMIVNSDNNAMTILVNQISPSRISDIFTDLGLPIPSGNADGTIDFMSAKLYSRLFRVLYNTTYLSEENSAKALELLSETQFDTGISSSIPSDIKLADKFGERTVYDPQRNPLFRELHDCGIVYLPDNPYLLCVMTKGNDFAKMEKIIEEISRLSYERLK